MSKGDRSYGVYDGSLTRLNPPISSELKDGQWLGVEVESQGDGGKVIVCAHRWEFREETKIRFRFLSGPNANKWRIFGTDALQNFTLDDSWAQKINIVQSYWVPCIKTGNGPLQHCMQNSKRDAVDDVFVTLSWNGTIFHNLGCLAYAQNSPLSIFPQFLMTGLTHLLLVSCGKLLRRPRSRQEFDDLMRLPRCDACTATEEEYNGGEKTHFKSRSRGDRCITRTFRRK